MLTYTTDAAKACNVSLNTIRNWCRDYGIFLSPGASAKGEARAFTGRDIEVLKYVALLRSEGMQRDAIIQRLGETSFSEIETNEPSDQGVDSTELTTVDTQESQQQVPAMLVILNDLEKRMDAKFEVLQQARRFDAVGFVGIGIIIGIAFCTLLIALASLYGVP